MCYFHALHTFADGSIGRELVSGRTGAQSSPGFIHTHVAAAPVVHRANTTCGRRDAAQRYRNPRTGCISPHHTILTLINIGYGEAPQDIPHVMGSSLPSEQ